jgi:hypothetical protein
MKRGTIVILIIVIVAVAAASASVWYHYRNQRRAQQFWGTTTAVLIDKAPHVELVRLGDVDRTLSLDADVAETPAAEEKPADPDAPPPPKAVEFNQTPWIVVETKDAAQAKGIANLRRALVLDTTFDWTSPPPADEPQWQYGVSVNDGRNWGTVLFDFDSRQVGLAGGRKTALLEAEANRDFQQFFAEQFPQDGEQVEARPPADVPAREGAPPVGEKPQQAEPAGDAKQP